MPDRYDTSDSIEGQFQPGSAEKVLLNKLDITNPDEMDDVELYLLDEFQRKLLEDVESDQQITVADLCKWHNDWLGSVYEWAGQFRSVNMQKNGFMFASSNLIPRLMNQFEEKYLTIYTPCIGFEEQKIIEALAICHVEFIIIHPFREGNGRLSRVLATIMTLQAGLPLLDFTWISENQDQYISAIHQGHGGDYEAMRRVFSKVLQASMI